MKINEEKNVYIERFNRVEEKLKELDKRYSILKRKLNNKNINTKDIKKIYCEMQDVIKEFNFNVARREHLIKKIKY